MLSVSLALTPAAGVWGGTAALLSYGQGSAHIHYDHDAPLRSIQQAARQLNTQGVTAVSLDNEGWTYDRQWAFYCGFAPTKDKVVVKWASIDDDELDILNARRRAFDWARQIINAPAEEIYPEALADQATSYLHDIGGDAITATVVKGTELKAQGWTGLWHVGRGSARPAVMLTLDYNPTQRPDAPVAACLVGKGITFDSGGYSLKSNSSMVAMRCDMAGAATVTAALGYAIEQGLNQRVQLILCCAENMVSGEAYKLGDILTYKNGVSVEVVNTDAEGRLVLADGLIAASLTEATTIIDAATLTGAAMVAVGEDYNALFGLDKVLWQQAQQVSELVNEPAWPLPLEKWHRAQCPSAYAETANSRCVKGGGFGGASNAAGFLSRFVREDGKGWLHVDLAGAFKDSSDAHWAAGATGRGIAHLAALLMTRV
ncbi:aminopeptidase PepB [Thaumasiovibrio sp. DFM-14]|uniref:aminopeptidase PepB n=1 Tax=Thaumasiovibrio sp. DFM-14 TaxID=3384792 RepID=UPI0039A01BB1